MRSRIAVAIVATLATLGLTAGSAVAMGTDDPYEDMQVGVTYTVYEPQYTAGLTIKRSNGIDCTDGQDEALSVGYGGRGTTALNIVQGRPICADATGTGKKVWSGTIQGKRAVMIAYCDETDPAAWAACSRADVARVGGAITMVLPGASGLRATELDVITFGKAPLSAQQLIRLARSMQPVG